MSFQVYIPGHPLNRFVRFLYSPKGPMPYRHEKVLPSPQADLKINFGGRFLAKRADAPHELPVDPDGWCMGVWDQYHTVIWPQDPDFIGVSFWPGGAYALLGIDINALHNQLIPLGDVWGSFTAEMRERLYEAGEPQARFRLLEQLLIDRMHRVVNFDKIDLALNTIKSGHGLMEVGRLQPSAHFTRKHLITLFNSVVGVSPKRLARLYRLQGLIETINQARPISWTAVAQDFLFSDQAHFNKEFKLFTGHTPGDYLVRRNRVVNETPDHAAYMQLLPVTPAQ